MRVISGKDMMIRGSEILRYGDKGGERTREDIEVIGMDIREEKI